MGGWHVIIGYQYIITRLNETNILESSTINNVEGGISAWNFLHPPPPKKTPHDYCKGWGGGFYKIHYPKDLSPTHKTIIYTMYNPWDLASQQVLAEAVKGNSM